MENDKVDHLVKQAQTPKDSLIEQALASSPFDELREGIMNKKATTKAKANQDSRSAIGARTKYLVCSAAAILFIAAGSFYLVQNSGSKNVEFGSESSQEADANGNTSADEARDLRFELPKKVVMEASAIEIDIAGETFLAPKTSTVTPPDFAFDENGEPIQPEQTEVSDMTEGTTYIQGDRQGDDHIFRTFTLTWKQNESTIETFFALASDGTDWWVYMVWSETAPDPVALTEEWDKSNAIWKAKIGESVTGDYEIPITDWEGKEDGMLKIENLRLSTPGFHEYPIEEYQQRAATEVDTVDPETN